MTRADLPIGVFDSGIGGLTVVRALRRILPEESIIYLGDTARVPYAASPTRPSSAMPCRREPSSPATTPS